MTSKKNPDEVLPGFEIYAELKPIIPFWQWFVAALLTGVLSLGYATFPEVRDLFGLFVLVLLFPVIAFGFALYFRGKSFTVGIKREGGQLLMAGQTISENIASPSKVEFRTPTRVYVEKPGTRMQLKKMVLRFRSPLDAQKVMDWLHEKIKSSSEMIPNFTDEIWALVYAGEYVKRSKITFERNVCFVVDPGRNIFDVQPKTLQRKDENTLIVKTGFWRIGTIIMKFDSTTDAVTVEQKLRAQIEHKGKIDSFSNT